MTSRIHLVAEAGEQTFLKNCFFSQPFKVISIRENRLQKELRIMIMSSSPGILDNDQYQMIFEIEAGAALQVVTQGYQRLFTMQHSASQQIDVRLANNSSFCFLPHPTVPHKGSDFTTRNNIHLAGNHNLLWTEIITCGRKLSGEIFLFKKYHSITNIYLRGKMVVRENLLLEPGVRNLKALGQLEGFTHQSSLLFINDRLKMEPITAACINALSNVGGISFGVSLLPVNGLIIRILGHAGEQLFECNSRLANLIIKYGQENFLKADW